MPFVNISIYEGHGKERKDELARRITETVSDVCKVPAQAVWVTFNSEAAWVKLICRAAASKARKPFSEGSLAVICRHPDT